MIKKDTYKKKPRKATRRAISRKPTKGRSSLFKLWGRVSKKEIFKAQIEQIRNRFKIRQNGFPPEPPYDQAIIDFAKDNEVVSFDFPKEVPTPKNWKGSMEQLEKRVDRLIASSELEPLIPWRKMIVTYVLYDFFMLPKIADACVLAFDEEDQEYPLIIKMSRYASVNELLSFTKENGHIIDKLQRRFGDIDHPIKHIRKRSVEKRLKDDYIYNNGEKETAEIASGLEEIVGVDNTPSDHVIRKTKKRELKRRR